MTAGHDAGRRRVAGVGRRTSRRRALLPPRTGVQPPRAIVRRSTESWALQSALERHGLGPVAGVDEAGRGACAGPLAVAACILRPGDAKKFEGLTDSKLLTAEERERFAAIIRRRALDWHVLLVDPPEVDRRGVHAANIDGMRRAVARLDVRPGYVLTDGFPVSGFGVPALAVPKGDLAAACVAAASVLAKTTRDRLMAALHEKHPEYGFDVHKGYCTPTHSAALAEHGPSAEHRFSFVNVAAAARDRDQDGPADGVRHNGAVTVDVVVQNAEEADELAGFDGVAGDPDDVGAGPEGGEPR